jgi:hypothetical protein
VAVRKKTANEFASKMLPIIDAIRARGLTTLAQIAEILEHPERLVEHMRAKARINIP